MLYGGAAGGGKSHLIRAAHILWCACVPGLQTALFRRNYPDLIRNHMHGPGSFHEILGPAVREGHVEIVTKEIRFANGSRITLNHLHNRKDLDKYQGAEFHVLSCDELTHFTDDEYRYLRGRCRVGALKLPPGIQWKFPRCLHGANPGSIGHHWVKEGFVDPGEYVLHKTGKKDGGMLRQFIPARLEDNPSLLENDPDYEDRLEGLGDPMLVRAMRTGDWNVVAGAMFGDVWRHELHVIRPFAIPETWEIWRGGDDGFAKPAAIYWLTQDPDRKTIYVIDELYGEKMRPEHIAERTIDGDRRQVMQDGYGEQYYCKERLSGIMDAAAFADTGLNEPGTQAPARARQMNALGCNWKPCTKAPGSRIQRAQNFHRLLQPNPNDPHGMPGLRFFDRCKHAIRTIPALERDDKNVEDVDTDGEDHAYDAICYGLQRRQSTKGIVKVSGT